MLPTRQQAEELLKLGEKNNPGPWGDHSRVAAHCAECIARACPHMDSEKAYILGLLHDIGRNFGVRYMGHVADGYSYMLSLDYDEVARICLTHSFNNQNIDEYIGKNDTSEEEYRLIVTNLKSIEMDDYDRLIQLCDALAGNEQPIEVEKRMDEIKKRYGYYPEKKWETNLRLKKYFDTLCSQDIYSLY